MSRPSCTQFTTINITHTTHTATWDHRPWPVSLSLTYTLPPGITDHDLCPWPTHCLLGSPTLTCVLDLRTASWNHRPWPVSLTYKLPPGIIDIDLCLCPWPTHCLPGSSTLTCVLDLYTASWDHRPWPVSLTYTLPPGIIDLDLCPWPIHCLLGSSTLTCTLTPGIIDLHLCPSPSNLTQTVLIWCQISRPKVNLFKKLLSRQTDRHKRGKNRSCDSEHAPSEVVRYPSTTTRYSLAVY